MLFTHTIGMIVHPFSVSLAYIIPTAGLLSNPFFSICALAMRFISSGVLPSSFFWSKSIYWTIPSRGTIKLLPSLFIRDGSWIIGI
ncbi:MAG: hypothetical protein ACD_48C00201G0001 [uncultured bacterium]|nr:MAG: hypothetical protein ACD_48C00201G0001 [uncultured bacterium]